MRWAEPPPAIGPPWWDGARSSSCGPPSTSSRRRPWRASWASPIQRSFHERRDQHSVHALLGLLLAPDRDHRGWLSEGRRLHPEALDRPARQVGHRGGGGG